MPTVTYKKLLAQKRPATTSASFLYKPPTNGRAEITSLIICNTTASPATFSLYNDKDGANFNADTALYLGITISGNSTSFLCFDGNLFLDTSSANLGCFSSIAGALNFTVYGIEMVDT